MTTTQTTDKAPTDAEMLDAYSAELERQAQAWAARLPRRTRGAK